MSTEEQKTYLDTLRYDYVAAVHDKDLAELHYQKLEQMAEQNALMLAFWAGFEALVAKHKWNPYDKLKLLNAAMQKFDRAVAADPNQAEIRFLRFSVEHYLPDFLKKQNHLEEDRRIIFQFFDSSLPDATTQAAIARFMLESGRCGRAETKKYSNFL
ncbi:MAG: hypothetical protein ACFCUI_12530 [Bernardetiaceae bacterium]